MKTFQTTQEIQLVLRFFVCYFLFFFHQMIKKIKKWHACTVVESFVNISNSVHLK